MAKRTFEGITTEDLEKELAERTAATRAANEALSARLAREAEEKAQAEQKAKEKARKEAYIEIEKLAKEAQSFLKKATDLADANEASFTIVLGDTTHSYFGDSGGWYNSSQNC